jgi:predicted transcriptional regulator
MKSVRLDPEAEKRLERAAEVAGVSELEFIRQAIAARPTKS